MPPARPDGTGDTRTERVPTAPTVEIERLASDARSHGLVWLRDHFLSDPTDPDHLPTLLAVMNLDLEKPGAGSQRLTEYRRVFAALRTTPEGRRAAQELEKEHSHRVITVTPRPGSVAQLRLDAITENTPRPDLISAPSMSVERSTSGAGDVPELSQAVAAELGFSELVRLGQGGFGTVYAARQPGVGNRLVAIKYTAARSREPQVLAALQHPNIMPVWSVHEYAGHRVFCMPLHGRTTLADVLKMIDRTKSLPATGAGFLSAASVTEVEASATATPVETEVELPVEALDYESDRQRLEKLGYVDSVLQGMTRMADALAHAHRRRVIHLDIKPANILVTDDGGFMILDFGLAYQNGLPASPEAGGTVRYMAPEQLAAFVGGKRVRPDPRMDLYALGLVFFELLTGRHPFAESLAPGMKREDWVAARHRLPPSARRLNPAVSPSVEAIICKLLHPDRQQRYQSAEQLLTDLTRQRDNQPLQHAANPSLWERFTKFRRRHPVFSVAVMAGVMAVMAAGGFWAAHTASQQAEAEKVVREAAEAKDRLAEVLADQTAIRIDAGSLRSPDARRQAIAVVEKWRSAYHVDAAGEWRRRPEFARLSADDRQRLTDALGEQALLAAHAERLNASGRSANNRLAALERAVDWNQRAESVLGRTPPAAVSEQRVTLAKLIGRNLPSLPPPPPDGDLDLYLRALGQIADGDHRAAAVALAELEKRQPKHAAGQFALGYVYQLAGRFNDAVERYQVAKALADHDPRATFNRGVLQLFHRHPDEAVTDLTTAIDRDPKFEDAYAVRATALYQLATRLRGQGDVKGEERKCNLALSDIDTAIELGGRRYRHVYLRSILRTMIGDAAGAEADLKALETIIPTDDQDYVHRGNRRNQESRPFDALADYTKATELNPLSLQAWNNLAAQQAALKHTRPAAESFARVIELMPDMVSARFQRAVLLARLEEYDQAIRLIDGVTPPDADTYIQKAAVFALSSQINLNDRAEVLAALRVAVRAGVLDWEAYDRDPDFDPVRGLPDFVNFRAAKGRLAE